MVVSVYSQGNRKLKFETLAGSAFVLTRNLHCGSLLRNLWMHASLYTGGVAVSGAIASTPQCTAFLPDRKAGTSLAAKNDHEF
jgi:hypothetical protein